MLDRLPLDLRPVPGRVGWYRTVVGDWQVLEARVLEIQDSHPLGQWQLVCGMLGHDEGHAIHAIDGVSAVDVARAFGTGSHHGSRTNQVCDELARVCQVAPLRPYFADAAGFKCRFEPRISAKQAEAIEQILTVGLELYLSEWSGAGPLLADALVAENRLQLWWD